MNFEKYAADRLQNYRSPVDADRLWAGIEADLRPKNRRPFAWWWTAGLLSAVVVAGGIGLSFAEKQPAGTPQKEAIPAALRAIAAADAPKAIAPETSRTPQPSRDASGHLSQSKSLIFKGKTGSSTAAEDAEAAAFFAEITAAPRRVFSETGLLAAGAVPQVFSENEAALRFGQMAPPEAGCYSFRSRLQMRPYLGVYGGAQYPMKTLEAKDAEFESTAAARRETESVLEAVSAGGFLGIELSNNLFAEAGAEFHRINERFDWLRTQRDTVGQIATVGIFINAPGDTTFFTDTVHIVRETRTEKRTYNRYSFVNVPLAIGYTWHPSARLSVYGKAGICLNLSFRQKAEIVDVSGSPRLFVSENVGSDYPFRSKIGIAPFATLGARYELGSRLDLFGEARYLHHTTQITTDAYPIRQQYRLPGLNLGLRFKF